MLRIKILLSCIGIGEDGGGQGGNRPQRLEVNEVYLGKPENEYLFLFFRYQKSN